MSTRTPRLSYAREFLSGVYPKNLETDPFTRQLFLKNLLCIVKKSVVNNRRVLRTVKGYIELRNQRG